MKNITIELPKVIRVYEWKALYILREFFSELYPNLKLAELGFSGDQFNGVLFFGDFQTAIKDANVVKVIKEIKDYDNK